MSEQSMCKQCGAKIELASGVWRSVNDPRSADCWNDDGGIQTHEPTAHPAGRSTGTGNPPQIVDEYAWNGAQATVALGMPYYSLLVAVFLTSDTENLARLQFAFPQVYEDMVYYRDKRPT